MKKISKLLVLAVLLVALATNSLYAEVWIGDKGAKTNQKASATCLPATNSNELTVNNVRAYLETNGTMWFKEIAEYEVPKNSGKTSMFCAALWIGGLDVNRQLKLAAVRFRQIGDDYWTGPLTLVGATIDQETCSQYDKHFPMSQKMVREHISNWDNPEYTMPAAIRDWPAHGDQSKGQSYYLAPFYDVDGDGEYNPYNGDYPYYDFENELCPWTQENIEKAAQGLLPKTPEELWMNSPAQASLPVKTNNMVYADHVLKGDETLFWIFNDKGGNHTESKGEPIGLEIRGQAFAFTTNDHINNMTFYSYEIINRSTYTLTNTYFSQWVDPDLGYSHDDYVGCDVARGLGYCYNGYEVDGSGQTHHYGSQPPAVGVDFFQGPYMDKDGRDNPKFYKDSASQVGYCDRFLKSDYELDQMAINGVNFGDGIVDNERFGMRRFVYHNNDRSVTGDPEVAYQYYYMLQGIWRDGTKMKYGANAHQSNGASGPDCDFMFPGLTDPCNWGTAGVDPGIAFTGGEGWTEVAVGNAPNDRRFMQSAGPFTLEPGAVNYITVGIPWARATAGGRMASVNLLKIADDQCQSLFENCFKVLDGPDAPDITIRELDQELILMLSNDEMSNNFNEQYAERDQTIPEGRSKEVTTVVTDSMTLTLDGGKDTTIYTQKYNTTTEFVEYDRIYRFEGYQIYQLANSEVSVTDLDDPDKAQLIAQCDIENYRKDGSAIGQLINWIYDDALGTSVATEMVNGANKGIFHSVQVTEDKFASTASRLVNHKTYYFMAIAYAYNEYEKYSVEPEDDGLYGQKTVYLAGRKNIKSYSGIPHNVQPQYGGTQLNAQYGTQPQITRLEGQGNGGFALELTKATRDEIMKGAPWKVDAVEYEKNAGPIDVRVVDPLKVKPYDFILKIQNTDESAEEVTDTAIWVLDVIDEYGSVIETISADSGVTINDINEQILFDYGISINIKDAPFVINQTEISNWINEFQGGMTFTNQMRYAQVNAITSSITYSGDDRWLSGVQDVEGDNAANWIRSGQQTAGAWESVSSDGKGVKDEFSQWRTEDYFYPVKNTDLNPSGWTTRAWKDPSGQFEMLIGGTWAPYVLASAYDGGPQAKYIAHDGVTAEPSPAYYDFTLLASALYTPGFNQTMTNLYSVDIVLTPNKDLWTRAIVLEACDDPSKSVGGALRHEPRRSPSVDKNGQPDGTGNGMGWFPGYAINVETGERLNIMFSENSADPANNGADMLFNPTSAEYLLDEEGQFVYEEIPNTRIKKPIPVWGGKHYVYVCGSTGNTNSNYYRLTTITKRTSDNSFDCGAYDECAWLMNKFNSFVGQDGAGPRRLKMQLFNNVMWTSIAMPVRLKEDKWLSNEATIKIRVTRPYMRYSSKWGAEPTAYAAENNNFPRFSFTTRNIAVENNKPERAESALDMINIVPNPYYGFSTYESTALENYIKIVNLPKNCTISIFTVNGTLIRKLTKGDEGTTFVNWDLKNSANIPISSGMYIIHVAVPGVGERTLKFFAAMRPTDLNAF